MKTETELRTEVYNALKVNVTNVYWKGNPPVNPSYPSAWYSKLDNVGGYVFGTHLNSEEIQFQVEIITNVDDITGMDSTLEDVKTSMHSIKYRLFSAPNETFQTEDNKNSRITRWEIQNV